MRHAVFRRLRWTSATAFLLGAASALSFAPLGWWPLIWPIMGGLFLLADNADNSRRAAWLGLCFGLGAFLTGVSWVYVSISEFGGLPPALALISAFLFCLVLALFPAIACGAFRQHRGQSQLMNATLFAAFWGLTEWLRGWIFTGFPWLAIGYSQTPGASGSPLSGYAPILGVFGISTLTALLAALLAEYVRHYFRRRNTGTSPPPLSLLKSNNITAALAIISILICGQALREVRWTQPFGTPITVALLQGNVAQDMKWVPQRVADSLANYLELVRQHPAELTLMPETALPAFFNRLPKEYLATLTELAKRQNGDIAFGTVINDGDRYTNSVVSLGTAPQQRYNKTHLVPFGEFTPPGFNWIVRQMNIPMADFARGAPGQPPLSLAGQRIAMDICYEDVFGEEIIIAAEHASILANVSNTAWFGRSWAQPQHLQISRMRAAETGRPMLRATNTGMTAVINPDGSVKATLEPFTRGALTATVQGTHGLTPYVRFGNSLALALMLLCLIPPLISAARLRYRAEA